MGTVHGNLCNFMMIYRCFLLRKRNVSDQYRRENYNTHFIGNTSPPPPPHWKSFRLWDNAQKYGTSEEATYGSVIRRIVDKVYMLANQGKSKDRFVIFDTFCFFHGRNGYSNAPLSHVIRTFPVLFRLSCNLTEQVMKSPCQFGCTYEITLRRLSGLSWMLWCGNL